MRARFLPLVAIFAALGIALSSCGSTGSSTESTVQTASPSAIERADSICREFRGEIVKLAEGALTHAPQTTLELTTERLVRPSIPLLKRVDKRMRALRATAHSESFDLYSNLFDPFIVLAEKRLQAGLENDQTRSRGLEEQMTDLSLVQRRAARMAGLHACDVD